MTANGCENSISDIINEPSELVITLSSIPVSCFDDCDGTIIGSVNGGLAPYTYSLDGNSFQNSNTFDNLCVDYIISQLRIIIIVCLQTQPSFRTCSCNCHNFCKWHYLETLQGSFLING